MGKLINYVAETSSNAGLTLEETACMMMILKDKPRRASQIRTELRQVLSKLACAECNGKRRNKRGQNSPKPTGK